MCSGSRVGLMYGPAGLPISPRLHWLWKQVINFFVIVSRMNFSAVTLQLQKSATNSYNPGRFMEWKVLNEDSQLQQIIHESESRPQVVFKHSTRCAISAIAKGRLDRGTSPENTDFYYLDLIRYRNISNKIAAIFSVHHESPQVLIIRNGRCVYDESHIGINLKEITRALNI